MNEMRKVTKKAWVAVVLLVVVVLTVRWIVVSQRGPGSTTVIEAQGMDMSAMKAPIGVFPVKTNFASEREVGETETFPATTMAYSDEDIIARVPGLVKTILVYPGARVTAGQLLATLQANELGSAASSASLTASAMESGARGAEKAISQQRSAIKRAEFEFKSALGEEMAAKAEVEAMAAFVMGAEQAVEEADARVKETEASLAYAKINVERQRNLYEKGAIARNRVDEAERELGEAQARLDQAKAQVKITASSLVAMKSKFRAAQSISLQASANVEALRAAVGEATANLSKVQEDFTTAKSQAASARANAMSAGTLSSYTDLRASDSGIVSERLVSPGSSVMPGEIILRLKIDRQLRVQAEIPQNRAPTVGFGTKVRITVNDLTLEAKITSVFPSIESSTRSFRVEAMIGNPDGQIKPGSYAEIEIATSMPALTLSVAHEAIKTAGDGTHYVWIVKEKPGVPTADSIYTCTMHPQIRQKGPGKCPICKMDLVPLDSSGNYSVEKRTVTIGVSDSKYVAVLTGLNVGEQVTCAGDQELFPGAAISIVTTNIQNAPIKVKEEHSGH